MKDVANDLHCQAEYGDQSPDELVHVQGVGTMMNWESRELQELATVERGKFSARPRNDPRYYGGRYPFVQTGDIAGAKGILHTYKQTLNELGLKVSRIFPKGTILITIAANIGEVAIAGFDVACPDSVVAISPNGGVDRVWLLHSLMLRKKDLDAIATQNAQKNINLQVLRPLVFDVPPYAEQKSIGRILFLWNQAIDHAERLIDAKRERRAWLMQQLLTGKRRLPRFGPPAGKRQIPKDWQETPLAKLFSPVRRKNDKGVTRVLTASGNHGLIDQKDYFNRSVAGERLQDYYLLRKGEFAYNRSSMDGYPCGAIKRLYDYEEGVLSTLYICFQQSSELVLPEFYEHLFESGFLDRQLGEVVQIGARAHGLLNITLQDFFSLKVPCPPLKEQQAIAATIQVAGEEIELMQEQLASLKDQKRGLMQQLLTGKRRLASKG